MTTSTSNPTSSGSTAAGVRSAAEAVDISLRAISTDPRPGIWIERLPESAVRRAAAEVDDRVRRGETLPLAGTTLAVKANIDTAGIDTTAGCPAYARPAPRHAPVVQALVDAGTVVVGVTNMDQFATGLVGTRSPYGICPNAHWDGLVAGGSSSGSAVAVALGMVDLALGTDTAGSGRVPAAANGIVGVKPTRGRLSLTGVVPACASLDCVSVFATDLSLADAAVQVAASVDDPSDPWQRSAPLAPLTAGVRIAVPDPAALLVDGDESARARHAAASALAVDRLAARHQVVPLQPSDLALLVDTGRLLYEGAFVAERYASVGAFVDEHPDQVEPTVERIISAAGRLPAWQLAADLATLAAARRRCEELFRRVDVVMLPTVARLPTVTEVQAAPIEVNSMLGTYTNFVNLLDLAAVTVPVGAPDTAPSRPHPPHSLSLIGPAWSDEVLVSLARSIAGAPASRRAR